MDGGDIAAPYLASVAVIATICHTLCGARQSSVTVYV